MFDNNDELENLLNGMVDIVSVGFDLLLIPGFSTLVTIQLIRQNYAEQREKKKRR